MRDHGTHACYVHGPNPGSQRGGCRCDPCREANRNAERATRARIAPPYVAAGPARAHVEHLAEHGVGLKQITKVTGLPHGTLSKLIYGDPSRDREPSKRIRPGTAEKILAVTPSDVADGGQTPAGPVWVKIDELTAAGIPRGEIARRLGQAGPGLQLSRNAVSGRNARAVAELHRQFRAGQFTYEKRTRWDTETVTVQPPAADHDVRTAVARANATDRRARYRGETQRTTIVDDIDQLTVDLAEVLEDRQAQAEWRTQAACRGRDTWMFFPDPGDTETANAARRICRSCFVRDQCTAAHVDQTDGIFGDTAAPVRVRTRAVA